MSDLGINIINILNNIINLLQALIQKVKANNELLKSNQQLLIETRNLISGMSGEGAAKIPELGDDLEKIISQLQKGVQTFNLNSILNDIRGIMDQIGYKKPPEEIVEQESEISDESEGSDIVQEFKGMKTKTQDEDDGEDHLIRPSSMFK
jgi:hypothetical protein